MRKRLRENARYDFTWKSQILGPLLNTAAIDTAPSYFENEVHGLPQPYFDGPGALTSLSTK